jgi:valyl-tRNA synthetase
MNSANYWILVNYYFLEEDLDNNLKSYELSHSVNSIYKFLWDSYANWYVEYLKTANEEESKFAKELYRQFIISISPYCPFEAEALWKEFFGENELLAGYIKDKEWSKKALSIYFGKNDFDSLKSDSRYTNFDDVTVFVSQMRSVRGLFAIDPALPIEVYCQNKTLIEYSSFIKLVSKIIIVDNTKEGLYSTESEKFSYQIDILKYIKDIPKEQERTSKIILSLQKQIAGLESQLSNQSFIQNAEPEVVLEKKQDLVSRQVELREQDHKLKFLSYA